MTRAFPQRPVVGVGVVVLRGDEVLLIERGQPPRKGQWSLPGGGQELGETVFEAGRREVFEETGLALDELHLLTVVDLIERDEAGIVRYHYTLVDLVALSTDGEPRPGSDACAACWVAIDDVPRMTLWEETKRIIALAADRRSRGLLPCDPSPSGS